jgi:hypothetical protein
VLTEIGNELPAGLDDVVIPVLDRNPARHFIKKLRAGKPKADEIV